MAIAEILITLLKMLCWSWLGTNMISRTDVDPNVQPRYAIPDAEQHIYEPWQKIEEDFDRLTSLLAAASKWVNVPDPDGVTFDALRSDISDSISEALLDANLLPERDYRQLGMGHISWQPDNSADRAALQIDGPALIETAKSRTPSDLELVAITLQMELKPLLQQGRDRTWAVAAQLERAHEMMEAAARANEAWWWCHSFGRLYQHRAEEVKMIRAELEVFLVHEYPEMLVRIERFAHSLEFLSNLLRISQGKARIAYEKLQEGACEETIKRVLL